ncbi:MAG: hypothetical protein CME62_04060 [Halobacteriovoraceae bacterium]|nr:hypothetical protein [Halobacteriovoraceae bacterium]
MTAEAAHKAAELVTSLKADPTVQIIGTTLFAIAVIHTFMVKKFEEIGHKYPDGSPKAELFHFLGEVEAVFGMWAGVLILFLTVIAGGTGAVAFLESMNFTEPAFVFVIMCMAGTRPVIKFAEQIIVAVSKMIPLNGKFSFYLSALVIGPLLGSFITEPAAMTVTALILQKNYYSKPDMSLKFKYATLGLLFVNISIGGTLTHFAAPPVLMVAGTWGWGMAHMIGHFGYKAAIAVVINAILIAWAFRKELAGDFSLRPEDRKEKMHPTWWITSIHLIFLALVVTSAHHMVIFLGAFLFFLGFTTVTKEYQDTIKLKESLLVGFFLGGLVVLGSLQAWWLQPLLAGMDNIPLYLGSTALTGITDNAALTYLGSLVEGITDEQKYFLVAGAVTGGGLTVIANAPNPAGFGILKENFGKEGISPLGLLKAALLPTFVALICFYFLVSL